MSHVLIKHGYQQAKKLLLIQLLLIVVISFFALFKEFEIAIALLSGGIAVLLGNSYFVYKAFSKTGAQQNKKVVGAFYIGESVKIVISITLLAIAFTVLAGFEIYVLVGYIAALLSQWLAPIIVKTH